MSQLFAVIETILPVFGLIVVGFGCGRVGLLGEGAAAVLNRYVVYLALPTLLFRVIAELDWPTIDQPGFLIGYSLGVLVCFFVALGFARLLRKPPIDGVLEGTSAAYANNGYMGLPLSIVMFGNAGILPAIGSMIVTVALLFPLGIGMIEWALRADGRKRDLVLRVGWAILRNPIIASTLIGALFAICRLKLPAPALSFMHLLGDTTAPVALVTLGVFLAQTGGIAVSLPVGVLVAIKLILQPLVTAAIVYWLIPTPRLWADSALLLAALPTGTGPVMLAGLYDREIATSSRVVILSTLISILPLALLLGAMRNGF